jgi:hypothetical protein
LGMGTGKLNIANRQQYEQLEKDNIPFVPRDDDKVNDLVAMFHSKGPLDIIFHKYWDAKTGMIDEELRNAEYTDDDEDDADDPDFIDFSPFKNDFGGFQVTDIDDLTAITDMDMSSNATDNYSNRRPATTATSSKGNRSNPSRSKSSQGQAVESASSIGLISGLSITQINEHDDEEDQNDTGNNSVSMDAQTPSVLTSRTNVSKALSVASRASSKKSNDKGSGGTGRRYSNASSKSGSNGSNGSKCGRVSNNSKGSKTAYRRMLMPTGKRRVSSLALSQSGADSNVDDYSIDFMIPASHRSLLSDATMISETLAHRQTWKTLEEKYFDELYNLLLDMEKNKFKTKENPMAVADLLQFGGLEGICREYA